VVGINKYPDAPLRGCVKDATDFARLLETNGDQSPNFDVLLQTDVPRKSTLREMIVDLFSGKNEIALFYFSGHGMVNELGGYLLTPDYRRHDEGVSMNDILVLANSSEAIHKVVILDCCHAGALTAPILSHSSMGHINEGVTILTASKKDEVAVEVNGKGVFTNLLLEAMKGGAADVNGHITPGSIYAYIEQALGPWEQRPVFKTNVSGFASLRRVTPRIDVGILRKITEYFPKPDMPHNLDPSYEHTNDPGIEHVNIPPYANEANVQVFKMLQKMESAGLVEPVDEEHMYYAAINSKSCRLTPLGAHFWRLVDEKKI
jgi:hypothetical protein